MDGPLESLALDDSERDVFDNVNGFVAAASRLELPPKVG